MFRKASRVALEHRAYHDPLTGLPNRIFLKDRFEQGRAVADKLLTRLNAPLDLGGNRVPVSASIGLALYPNDGKDASSLLRVVDRAMYGAKLAGKSCYQFHQAAAS